MLEKERLPKVSFKLNFRWIWPILTILAFDYLPINADAYVSLYDEQKIVIFEWGKSYFHLIVSFPSETSEGLCTTVGRLYEAKLVCFRLDSSVYIRKMKNKIHISELLDIWVLNNNKIQVFMRVPISFGVLIRVTFTTVSEMKAQMRLSRNLDPKYLKGSREICPSHAPCNHEAERFPRCRWLGGRGVDLKYKHLPFNM